MRTRGALPDAIAAEFSVAQAVRAGASLRRLRGSDLSRPFYGVRSLIQDDPQEEELDPYALQRRARLARARQYLPLMRPRHFFSHQTAASAYGAPLPLVFTEFGDPADGCDLDLHVSVLGSGPVPRTQGIVRHRAQPKMATIREVDGLPVSSPATTWASLGTLGLRDLIALGDYFCRVWRPGIGRPDVGKAPLTTLDQLRAAAAAGRRSGAANLREALTFIRLDSWSPRESAVRFELVRAGLPEPELNADVFDASGRFLGCVDMVYREKKVAIEYLGMLHGASWARDVERLAALRAAGWEVIEVTAPLLAKPAELVDRVRRALAR